MGEIQMRTAMSISSVVLISCLSANAFAAGSSFSGTYRVNGKDAKLNYMTVMPGGCFKDGIAFALSEKEVQPKPKESIGDVGFNAQMKSFGDAVVVTVCSRHDTWEVDHSNFSHSALKDAAGTWVDQLKVEGVTVANGEYSGHLVSIKDAKILDQPLEVNIVFHAKLP
jgi:hypothetical protein